MCKNKGSKSYQANKDFLVALFSHSFNGNWEALSAAAAHFKEIDHKKKTDTNSEFKNKCGTDIELSELNDIIFSCRDGRNWTVLHFAAAGNNLDIIKQILLFSTKLVFIRDNTEELTPIMVAARYGHLEACQLIAKACPDCVFQISRGGKSLLHYAVEGKNVKCVKYFIDLNVNVCFRVENCNEMIMNLYF
jgi:ankyrin repeat protein